MTAILDNNSKNSDFYTKLFKTESKLVFPSRVPVSKLDCKKR